MTETALPPVREKSGKKKISSKSGKCQGLLGFFRMSGKYQGILSHATQPLLVFFLHKVMSLNGACFFHCHFHQIALNFCCDVISRT